MFHFNRNMKAQNTKKIIIPTIIAIIILAVYSMITQPESEVDLSEYKRVTVKRVVDGDTFIYSENGENIRCRMIGIDTPESVAPEEERNTAEGVVASDFTKSLIDGKTVFLEYDVGKYDEYGRELVYVYLADGRMVQEILLSEGYARTMTIQPNVKYADRFAKLQREAR